MAWITLEMAQDIGVVPKVDIYSGWMKNRIVTNGEYRARLQRILSGFKYDEEEGLVDIPEETIRKAIG